MKFLYFVSDAKNERVWNNQVAYIGKKVLVIILRGYYYFIENI